MSIAGSSPERVAALREDPRVKRALVLMEKLRADSMSDEEKAEFAEMTQDVRDLDPNVLVD